MVVFRNYPWNNPSTSSGFLDGVQITAKGLNSYTQTNKTAQLTSLNTSCPPIIVNASLNATKTCSATLVQSTLRGGVNAMSLQVQFSATICNDGDRELKDIAIKDVQTDSSDVAITGTSVTVMSVLFLPADKCVSGTYYPYGQSITSTTVNYDRITVNATPVLSFLSPISQTATCHCSLC